MGGGVHRDDLRGIRRQRHEKFGRIDLLVDLGRLHELGRALVGIARMIDQVGDEGTSLKLFGAIREILPRSEEHTSELQSLMRISYAVFCLKKKKQTQHCSL